MLNTACVLPRNFHRSTVLASSFPIRVFNYLIGKKLPSIKQLGAELKLLRL